MANIPQKVMKRFVKTVPRFQKVLQIAKDKDVSEANTVDVLTDIFREVFGYDKLLEVTREVPIQGTYCDLALMVEDKVQFLVEAKAIGIKLKTPHIHKTVGYGAFDGIPWVVLTNGLEWRVYCIRFEQPINYDLICNFDFTVLNPRDQKDQECLFLLSKEGLNKNARDDFYKKVRIVNRYVIGRLILSEPVLTVLRHELKRMSEGVKVGVSDVEQIILTEVLKREVVEGEEAGAALKKVKHFYQKSSPHLSKKPRESVPLRPLQEESVTDSLLREAQNGKTLQQTDPGDKQ
jgi:hypothetical protein